MRQCHLYNIKQSVPLRPSHVMFIAQKRSYARNENFVLLFGKGKFILILAEDTLGFLNRKLPYYSGVHFYSDLLQRIINSRNGRLILERVLGILPSMAWALESRSSYLTLSHEWTLKTEKDRTWGRKNIEKHSKRYVCKTWCRMCLCWTWAS